ncbi:subunit of tubulin prefoldin [Clydaea vesicula]|uniref:Subunit of tubulin prefoldin n=1 Tax=Clydaea vesicula TaxID=447962 RepID=A0AAD5Y3B0_9FUNG|nr:subunit of tubulin prefoldin [Clydaea vesicula]
MDVSTLPLFQLQSVKQSLEDEIKLLSGSFGTLKTAQAKFNTSFDSLSTINKENTKKQSLIPLTGSLYVKGKLDNIETVIVDIGTGYYVEKSIKDAKEFYKGKVEYLSKNIEQLQETLIGKQKQYQILMDVMQQKVEQMQNEKK